LDLNPESEHLVKSLRTKTISVIPTGANGNTGNTGPGGRLGSGVWVSLRRGVTPKGWQVWGSGPRGAAPLGWYHQQAATLYNICYICSLKLHRTQPRVTLFTKVHPHKRSAWHCCGACAGLPPKGSPVIGWLICHCTSVSAWGPFWPPMPRPRLLPPRPPGEGGVGFP